MTAPEVISPSTVMVRRAVSISIVFMSRTINAHGWCVDERNAGPVDNPLSSTETATDDESHLAPGDSAVRHGRMMRTDF